MDDLGQGTVTEAVVSSLLGSGVIGGSGGPGAVTIVVKLEVVGFPSTGVRFSTFEVKVSHRLYPVVD